MKKQIAAFTIALFTFFTNINTETVTAERKGYDFSDALIQQYTEGKQEKFIELLKRNVSAKVIELMKDKGYFCTKFFTTRIEEACSDCRKAGFGEEMCNQIETDLQQEFASFLKKEEKTENVGSSENKTA